MVNCRFSAFKKLAVKKIYSQDCYKVPHITIIEIKCFGHVPRMDNDRHVAPKMLYLENNSWEAQTWSG